MNGGGGRGPIADPARVGRDALIRQGSRSPQAARARTDADRLLQLACLTVGAKTPGRPGEAAQLLQAAPQLAAACLHTATAVGDTASAAEILATDPSAANREGGPFGWTPLLYLAFSRLQPSALPSGAPSDPVGVARLLLEHGADPDTGFLWDGLPSPFTALTGVFGGGEHGTAAHPDELPLAQVILAAGADPNDNQTIYDRGLAQAIPHDDTAFLELLLDSGLGRGEGGPWQRALGDLLPAPAGILAEALHHAADAGLTARACLLLEHGADPQLASPHPHHGGLSPYRSALRHGNSDIGELLVAAGAVSSDGTTEDRFLGALLSADRPLVERMSAADPCRPAATRARHGDLVARAAVLNRPRAVILLRDLGFDLNALASTTALHESAIRGNLPMVELLLELGAEPALRDRMHDATPAGWARHARHHEIAARLDSASRSA